MLSTLRRINEPCVYIMQSERFAERSYVGFAVDPAQRVRRHNGEISGGAAATRSGRPWAILLVISGFSSQASALQFEHALQHPTSAARVRAATFAVIGSPPSGGSPARGRSGRSLTPAETITVARILTGVEPWRYTQLAAHFTSEAARVLWDVAADERTQNITVGPLSDFHARALERRALQMATHSAALLAERARVARAAQLKTGAAAMTAAPGSRASLADLEARSYGVACKLMAQRAQLAAHSMASPERERKLKSIKIAAKQADKNHEEALAALAAL
jgi:predicted GIY-YIG superfamily endonuclease